jgi:L-rhamnose 1-dehydrogenase
MARDQTPLGGSIIGISSISALVGGGEQAHYTPTKAGVTSLMQSAAVALGRYHIRCNALLPGTIRTQLNEEDLKDEGKLKYMEGRIPLGRIGVPSDMVGPAVFLACEELSGFVTGAQLLVDGGLFVNLQ